MKIFGLINVYYNAIRNIQLFKRHIKSFYRHNTPVKFANLCSLYFQRWTNRSVLSAFPIEIIIDPINICDLKCPLCPTGQRANTRSLGSMPYENYQRIIDELSRWLYKVRFYSWGEPLMHKDIYKMIAYATDKNIGTEISTNLNVFRESDSKTLLESGLELLIISLDGADDKTYSHYRIGGDFSRVINNISAVVKEKKKTGRKNPFIEIQFLVMRHNEYQIPKMKALAKELGVDRLRLGPVTVNVRNEEDLNWLPVDEQLSRYSYVENNDKIYSIRKKCEWLWRSMVINWDGTISPCCVYEGEKAVFGSLLDNKIEKLWNNEYYKKSRLIFARKDRREIMD